MYKNIMEYKTAQFRGEASALALCRFLNTNSISPQNIISISRDIDHDNNILLVYREETQCLTKQSSLEGSQRTLN